MFDFKIVVLALFLVTMFSVGIKKINAQSNGYTVISAIEADSLIKSDSTLLVVDIRTKPEYNGGHLKDAAHSNFLGFSFNRVFIDIDAERPIILYCQTGHRSKYAARKLLKMGFKNIYELEGGYKKWKEIELPITLNKGKNKK